jgi:type IV pilus assembly protein PilM
VLRNRTFKGKSVALLPPLNTVLSYPLRVAVGKQETLEAAIVREAQGVLEFPLEEAIVDYASIRPDPAGEEGSHVVLLLVMRREDVERHLRLVKQAGGVLESVESVATALIRIHAVLAPLDANPVLLCSVGRTGSSVVVASREGIVAHRNLHWGTQGLAEKLVENLKLEGKQRDADFLLRKHGLLHAIPAQEGAGERESRGTSGTVAQILAPLVDEFAHALHKITGYVRSLAANVVFGGAFLYGNGARVGGLSGYLEQELNMPVQVPDPRDKIHLDAAGAVPASTEGGDCGLAMGLAMRRVRWL